MELEPNSLDWNGNKLEHELELGDMKRTPVWSTKRWGRHLWTDPKLAKAVRVR